MNAFVLVCGNVFDGLSDGLTGPAQILVESNRITGKLADIVAMAGATAKVDFVMKDGVVFRKVQNDFATSQAGYNFCSAVHSLREQGNRTNACHECEYGQDPKGEAS